MVGAPPALRCAAALVCSGAVLRGPCMLQPGAGAPAGGAARHGFFLPCSAAGRYLEIFGRKNNLRNFWVTVRRLVQPLPLLLWPARSHVGASLRSCQPPRRTPPLPQVGNEVTGQGPPKEDQRAIEEGLRPANAVYGRAG